MAESLLCFLPPRLPDARRYLKSQNLLRLFYRPVWHPVDHFVATTQLHPGLWSNLNRRSFSPARQGSVLRRQWLGLRLVALNRQAVCFGYVDFEAVLPPNGVRLALRQRDLLRPAAQWQ